MKQYFKGTVTLLLAFILLFPNFALAEKMELDYSKFPTMMKNGQELVPLRAVAESLGYEVMWNGEERSVTLTLTNDMKMNSDDMMKDDTMDGMNGDDMMKDDTMDEMNGDDMMKDDAMDGMNGDDMMKDDAMDEMNGDDMMKDDAMDEMNGDDMMKDDTMDEMNGDDMMKDDAMDEMNMDGKYIVAITIGSTEMMINSTTHTLAFAPIIIQDRTYVDKEFVEMYLTTSMMKK